MPPLRPVRDLPVRYIGRRTEDLTVYELAREMVRFNRYRHGNVHQTVGYASSGRHDWLYGERRRRRR